MREGGRDGGKRERERESKLIWNVSVCDSNTTRKADMTFLDGMLIYIVYISSDTAT